MKFREIVFASGHQGLKVKKGRGLSRRGTLVIAGNAVRIPSSTAMFRVFRKTFTYLFKVDGVSSLPRWVCSHWMYVLISPGLIVVTSRLPKMSDQAGSLETQEEYSSFLACWG